MQPERRDELHVLPVTTPALAAAVRALRVAPAQYAYVGDAGANLITAEAAPHGESMAVLEGGRVVGCYRIELRAGPFAGSDCGDACASLHGLLIDRSCQGRGLGTRALAACCSDLARRHPRLRLLALTVDCANLPAIRAYRRAGFVEGGLYFGGGAGPQRLMLRRLGA